MYCFIFVYYLYQNAQLTNNVSNWVKKVNRGLKNNVLEVQNIMFIIRDGPHLNKVSFNYMYLFFLCQKLFTHNLFKNLTTFRIKQFFSMQPSNAKQNIPKQ